MSNSYVGWIPTVLGNLSFKLVGHSGYPFPFFRKIDEKGEGRIEIICLQKRIPFDYQIPTLVPIPDKYYLKLCSYIAHKFVNENIESAYLFFASGKIGETGTVQELEGRIYRIFKKDCSDQKLCFSNLSNAIDNDTIIDVSQNNEISIEEYAKNEAYLYCNFKLDRQGRCTLVDLVSIENCKKFDDDEARKLINQCFYFIKDAYHSHKHHNRSEDTLISAYPEKDHNNVVWSDHILKELYRYLIRQRPTFDKSSMGIFPYIRTFCKIIDPKKDNSEVGEEPNRDTLKGRTVALEELERSISISIEKLEDTLTHRRWFVGVSLAVFQMTFFYLFSSDVASSKDFVSENSTFIMMIAFISLPVLFSITKVINPLTWRSATTATNLLISRYDKPKIILITSFYGVVFILLGVLISLYS